MTDSFYLDNWPRLRLLLRNVDDNKNISLNITEPDNDGSVTPVVM